MSAPLNSIDNFHKHFTEIDLQAEIVDKFNFSIAEELIKEINPSVTEERIAEVCKMCSGNPWNAGILYLMIELRNTQDVSTT